MANFVRAGFSLLAWAFAASAASAQCVGWKPSPLRDHAGTDNYVNAVINWDPDGPGPLPPQLVIGGQFTEAGGVTVNGIASWDGSKWNSLAGGINGGTPSYYYPFVYGLAVIPAGFGSMSGKLLAYGAFDTIGGVAANSIAWWDGSAWHALGTGFPEAVFSATFWDADGPGPQGAQLIVGGYFEGVYDGVARWDGSAWQPMGAGFQLDADNDIYGYFHGRVTSLASFSPDGVSPPQLIAAGAIHYSGMVTVNGIARWDGTAWQSMSGGLTPGLSSYGVNIRGMTVYDPDGPGPARARLMVSGDFGNAGNRIVNGLASWTGNGWTSDIPGKGTTSLALTSWTPPNATTPRLVANVYYNYTFPQPGYTVEMWDGANWTQYGPTLDGGVYSFAPWTPPGSTQPQLTLGGYMSKYNGVWLDGVTTGNGGPWTPFTGAATDVIIYAMAPFRNALAAGGTFFIGDHPGDEAYDMLRWDGSGTVGTFGPGLEGTVRVLKSYIDGPNSVLVAGGNFVRTGGVVTVNHVASWTENTVAGTAMAQWTPMGTGLNDSVYALERFNNQIYAGGIFTASGDGATTLNRVAVWNGTSWQPVGAGFNQTVFALKAWNGSLYAAGNFFQSNGTNIGSLARWTGTAWVAAGSPSIPQTVDCLEVHNGNLIVGGFFGGASSPNLLQFNGTSFTGIGGGLSNGPVYSLLSYNGILYAGGLLASAGSTPVHGIAAWNGTAWSDMGGGADSGVLAMAPFHGELEVGGFFNNLANSTIPSSGWGRYALGETPWIALDPSPQQGSCGGQPATFTVVAAPGYPGLAYTWRRSGTPLTPGPTASGSYLLINGPGLTIANVHPGDAGTYDVVVSSSCGSATSAGAALSMCVADFNCSGTISVQDIFDFLSAWFAATPSSDVNGSGTITVQDIFDFLNRWFGGC